MYASGSANVPSDTLMFNVDICNVYYCAGIDFALVATPKYRKYDGERVHVFSFSENFSNHWVGNNLFFARTAAS